jgi:hypothetical protein
VNRHLLRFLVCGTVLLIAAAALWVSLWISVRGVEENQYVGFLGNDYLPSRHKKDKRWPTSLQGVERHLLERSNPVTKARWLETHRKGKPVLTVLSVDKANFKGRVRFTWLFGGEHDIEVREPFTRGAW